MTRKSVMVPVITLSLEVAGWLSQNETAPKRSSSGAVDLTMTVSLSTAQALQLWHDVNMHLVRGDEPDLSTRQITLLLTVYLEAPPHTVRDLARKLGVSKPVITRALDSLGKLELLTRRRDEADRRNVLVQRTVKGVLYLERLAETVGKLAKQV